MLTPKGAARGCAPAAAVSSLVWPTVRRFGGRSLSISLVRVIGRRGRSLDRLYRGSQASRRAGANPWRIPRTVCERLQERPGTRRAARRRRRGRRRRRARGTARTGFPIFRAALPWRASSTTDGHERSEHPEHQRDRHRAAEHAPSSSASLTSPMPMPLRVGERGEEEEERGAEGAERPLGPVERGLRDEHDRRPRAARSRSG